MADVALFVLGLLAGVATLALGVPLSIVLPLVPAVVAGVYDGRAHPRVRWGMSWAPALLGSLAWPVWAIVRDLFRDPPAPDGGLALSVGLAILASFALAFVVLALIASAATRALVGSSRR